LKGTSAGRGQDHAAVVGAFDMAKQARQLQTLQGV
jgi:hypothetical protein